MRLLQALTHRSFAFLWSGQTISRLGDNIYRIALAWWVLEKTGSAIAMGMVLIFTSVPLLLFTLIGGVAVDSIPRARLMIFSDVMRGLSVAVVAVLAFGQHLELWHLYIASTLFGFVEAFFQPAYNTIVPEITPREALPSANSLTTLSNELSGVIGPALGATIVAFGGIPLAFLLDAVSFFVSALCLLPLIQHASIPVSESSAQNVLASLKEGINTVREMTWIWLTLALTAFAVVTTGGLVNVALPLLVKTHLHADVGTLGILLSLGSVGSIISALWLGRATRIRHRGFMIYGWWILGALMSYGLPVPLIAVYIAAFIRGACNSITDLTWTNALQELVPRERLGRVSSIDLFGTWGMVPIGFAFDGWAVDTFGAPLVFVAGGLVSVFLACIGLLHPAIRKLD